jgi:monofunctional biosynthetic peptidoglycan transglycosylase
LAEDEDIDGAAAPTPQPTPAEPEPEPTPEPEAPEPEAIETPAEAAEPTPAAEPAPPAEPEPEPAPGPAPAPVVPPPPVAAAARKPTKGGRLRRIVLTVLAILVLGPPVWVMIYRFLPPPVTILMALRAIEGHGMDYRWRPLSQISPALVDAAVASEDGNFCSHHGFDFEAMEKAMKHNERRPNRIKGGSTISQQTAKNVFLWPGRDYVRKGVEAGYTVLIETLWGKQRIMEVYLNVVEFGPGVYGAEAASQRFFHEDASQLSPAQAARLVAVLPRPLKWSAEAPGAYVAKRSRRIGGGIGTVREAGLADCVLR